MKPLLSKTAQKTYFKNTKNATLGGTQARCSSQNKSQP